MSNTNEKLDVLSLGDFRVKKCVRGGFVVLDDYRDVGMASSPLAAFSRAEDMLAWLQEQLMPIVEFVEHPAVVAEPGQAIPCGPSFASSVATSIARGFL